jgi:dienelactone hydrolase
MGTTVTFKRPDEQIIQGYLAEPEHAAGAAAIVVIQEWWGVNEQIRGVADRLASAGYIALVPDLYRGKSTVEAEEAHHLMTGLNFGDAASQDIRGAVQFLKTRSAFDFHRYLARHAFANETAVGPGRIPQTQYDPVWSQQAWDRTFSFFGRWLR